MPTLHWLTREQDLQASGRAPYRLLEHVETYGDAQTENMLIQGDNLDGLKALLPYYAGKVKCIYIDPPYNTQSAFEHYDDNLEHTVWLSMMYPRLEMLRDLLSEDGMIFIQIDYRESARLKLIADEIFGETCFKNEIIVGRGTKNVQSQFNDIDSLSSGHDTIYLYAKNARRRLKKLSFSDNMQRGKWDTFWRGTDRPTMRYTLLGVTPDRGQWRWSKERALKAFDNYMHFVNNFSDNMAIDEYWNLFVEDNKEEPDFIRLSENGSVQYYVGPRNYKLASDVWMNTKVLGRITDFPHEKHEELIFYIIDWITNPGDLVLDSFIGSGTTAAVAHKMGRHYIGIEIGEHAVTHCIPRLQKVIEGEQGGISKATEWQGGGGFRFYRLGEAIFDDNGQINKGIRFPQLAAHVWFSETKTPWRDQSGEEQNPLLGIHDKTAYYLLFNGILRDKSVQGGNVLTSKILEALPEHAGPKVIYGERCLFSPARLKQLDITFKHTPYDIKGR